MMRKATLPICGTIVQLCGNSKQQINDLPW
jgi:hypothetical protein